MSAMVCQSGCRVASQRMIWGSSSIGATTPITGWVLDSWMIWSGLSMPSVILGSWYISAADDWKPTAGPPARISIRAGALAVDDQGAGDALMPRVDGVIRSEELVHRAVL